MCIAAALATAKRSNKFVILYKDGTLFHTRRSPRLQHECEACPPSHRTRSALRHPFPAGNIVRTEDGKERAGSIRTLLFLLLIEAVMTD